MAEFFEARRLRYHISVEIEDRWQLVEIVEDGRDQLGHAFRRADFEALESSVQMRARAALAKLSGKAVRVMRERLRADGYAAEELFLAESAAAVKPAERQVSTYGGDIPICRDFDDLLQRPGLRAVGLIMRPLLDRLGMTPIELLTLKALTAAVKRAEGGIDAALRHAARLQSDATGAKTRDRLAELEAIAEACRAQVRSAERVPAPAALGPIGLDRFIDAIAEHYPPAERRFRTLRGLAAATDGVPSYGAKLERLLELNRPELGDAAVALLDDGIACLLDHADVVQDLLGRQADLRAALISLADLADGKAPCAGGMPEAAAQLALLLLNRRLPETAASLWDRIRRSLAGPRPLGGDTPKAEQAAIAQLRAELLPRLPDAIRAAAETALAERELKLQQAMLDAMER
jgi:hypothetical protein